MNREIPRTLWCLRGRGRGVRCDWRKTRAGFELRVLWGDELFLTETFGDLPQLERRAEEFRATLETRGWERVPIEEGLAEPPQAAEADHVRTPRPAPEDTQTPRPVGNPPLVLVVDDEPGIRSFLRTYLTAAGYAVSEAADVDGALNALDEQPVDAVVLDVRMPDPTGWGRTGLEVLAFIRLQRAHSSLPVLILTGYSLDPEELSLIERHRADLFHKPEGFRTLLPRLDEVTGRRTAPKS